MLFVKLSSHKKVFAGAGCASPQKDIAGTTLQRQPQVRAAQARKRILQELPYNERRVLQGIPCKNKKNATLGLAKPSKI